MELKNKREIRKKYKLCVQCAEPLDREGIYCIKCNNANNKSKHNLVIKLHSENKCSSCAKPLDRKGWFCTDCCNNLKLRARERNLERRLNGLCVQCGADAEGKSYCQRCLDMRMQRYWRSKNKIYVNNQNLHQ